MTKNVSSVKDVKETKKTSAPKKEKATEDNSKIALLEAQLAELLKEREENKRLLDSIKLASALTSQPQQNEDTRIEVSCKELNGVELASMNREVIITLQYETPTICTKSELTQALRKPINRAMFEDGICVMDDKYLEEFNIKKKNIISEDEILQLLDEGIEQNIVKRFSELTNSKKNQNVSHVLIYMIAGFLLDGKLERIPRTSFDTIENYFDIKLRDIELLLKIYRDRRG